jgi:hypothetical protein
MVWLSFLNIVTYTQREQRLPAPWTLLTMTVIGGREHLQFPETFHDGSSLWGLTACQMHITVLGSTTSNKVAHQKPKMSHLEIYYIAEYLNTTF